MESLSRAFTNPEVKESVQSGHEDRDVTKTVLLLSSGIDSTSLLCLASKYYTEIQPMFFRYGNLAQDVEEEQSKKLVEWARNNVTGCFIHELEVVDISEQLSQLIDSPETFSGRDSSDHDHTVGYVPMRNMIFVSYAAAFAANRGYGSVLVGDSLDDFLHDEPVGSPTTHIRRTFIYLLDQIVQMNSLKGDVRVRAPLLDGRFSYTDSIDLLMENGWPLEFSYSCFEISDPDNPSPCGKCSTCRDRIEAFERAGYLDPLMMGGIQ